MMQKIKTFMLNFISTDSIIFRRRKRKIPLKY